MTFEPHPKDYFCGEGTVKKITDEKTKLVLSSSETEKYISQKNKKETLISLAKLLAKLESCELADVFSDCLKVVSIFNLAWKSRYL